MRLIPCQSSNLAGIAYTPGSTLFYVQFNNGSVYEYGPDEEAADRLTDILFDDKSQGSAFTHFKKYTPARKLTEEEVEALDLHA